jgi:hypothetical protein
MPLNTDVAILIVELNILAAPLCKKSIDVFIMFSQFGSISESQSPRLGSLSET